MTPLEKALMDEDKIDYCDQCENMKVVGRIGFCTVSEKILHPLMYTRGQGYGPARRCKNARPIHATVQDLVEATGKGNSK